MTELIQIKHCPFIPQPITVDGTLSSRIAKTISESVLGFMKKMNSPMEISEDDYSRLKREVLASLDFGNAVCSREELAIASGQIRISVEAFYKDVGDAEKPFYVGITNRLLNDLLWHFEKKTSDDLDEGASFPPRSVSTNWADLSLAYTRRISPDTLVSAGAYRSGDINSVGTFYLSAWKDLLNGSAGRNNFNLSLGSGAFSILSSNASGFDGERDVKRPNTFGVAPGLDASWMRETRLSERWQMRTAAEFSPWFPVGIALPITSLYMPLSAGTGFKYSLGESALLTGASLLAEFYPRNVQDLSSITLNFTRASVFAGFASPGWHTTVETAYSGNREVRLDASLTVPFRIFGVEAEASIQGGWSLYDTVGKTFPNYLMAYLRAKSSGVTVTSGGGYQNLSDKSPLPATHGMPELLFLEFYPLMLSLKSSGTSIVCGPPFWNGDIACRLPFDSEKEMGRDAGFFGGLICKKDASGLACNQPDTGFKFHLTYDRPLRTGDLWRADSFPTWDAGRYPVLTTMQQSKDVESFLKNLPNPTYENEISVLNVLAAVAYGTYNRESLAKVFGANETNDMSVKEIYENMWKYLFDAENAAPATVCRGYGKFIAKLASMMPLPFEAHVVSLATENQGHVLAMLRQPNGTYVIIDNGSFPAVDTGKKTYLEAMQSYSSLMNFPVQLAYRIYDEDGNLEETVFTKEGERLREALVPEKLPGFLQFR